MKIKMIDLFKLMLERRAPKKIRVLGMNMTFIETAEWGDYKSNDCCRLSEFRLTDYLNDEIEIIEESKKVEMPKHLSNEFIQDLDGIISDNDIKCIAHKVNEIINYLQYKEKKDE